MLRVTRLRKIEEREPRWRTLLALLKHAEGLPGAAQVQTEAAIIEQDRGLLADPDPVPNLVGTLTDALRAALNQAHAGYARAHEEGLSRLEKSGDWPKLSPEQKY